MGFNSSISELNEKSISTSLQSLENQDLLKFGMIPEFIGRLPVIATLEELDEEMLIEIMQEPKNALLKQYSALFKMDGIKLDIKNEALKEIANLAIEQQTGARGLRSIIEKILIDLMFDVPDKKNLESVVINRDTVLEKSQPILIYSNKQTNQKILANKSWI